MNDYIFDLPPIFTGLEDICESEIRSSMFSNSRRTESTSHAADIEKPKDEPFKEKDIFVNYGEFRTRSSTPEEFYYEEICERKICYDSIYHECEEDRIIDIFFDTIAKRLDTRARNNKNYKLSNVNYIRMSVCGCIYHKPYTEIQLAYCSTITVSRVRELVITVMRSIGRPYNVGKNVNLLAPLFKEKFGEQYDDEKVISYCKNHGGLRKYL